MLILSPTVSSLLFLQTLPWTFLALHQEHKPERTVMSYSNVGLTTPRGSGTSGYVQKNLSHLKPRDAVKPYPTDDFAKHRQRKPDPEILEHDRKRRIEVAVFELRDKLEEEGKKDDEEIEEECDALRRKMMEEDEAGKGKGGGSDVRGLKAHQVHDLAKAKIEETDRMRRALGIRKDYEEGSHWQRQEERLRNAVPEKEGTREPKEKERLRSRSRSRSESRSRSRERGDDPIRRGRHRDED